MIFFVFVVARSSRNDLGWSVSRAERGQFSPVGSWVSSVQIFVENRCDRQIKNVNFAPINTTEVLSEAYLEMPAREVGTLLLTVVCRQNLWKVLVTISIFVTPMPIFPLLSKKGLTASSARLI